MKLPNEEQEILERFRQAGLPAWIVGGTVRDLFLGRVPVDIDVAVGNRNPMVCIMTDEIHQVLSSFCTKVSKINQKGTIEGKFGNRTIQVTKIGPSIFLDMMRRDFTINGLAIDVFGEILDLASRLDDLNNKVLRQCNDKIFDTSPIRLLRAFRFASKLGFLISADLKELIQKEAHKILLAPREMWLSEFTQILMGEHKAFALTQMMECGLLQYMFPEFANSYEVTQSLPWHTSSVWGHTVRAVQASAPSPMVRWAAFLHDIGKPATRTITDGAIHFYHHDMLGADIIRTTFGARFRMSEDMIQRLAIMVEHHLRIVTYDSSWSDASVLRMDRTLGEEITNDMFLLAQADVTAGGKASESLDRLADFYSRLQGLRSRRGQVDSLLPTGIGGRIMQVLDLKEGKVIGQIKTELEDRIKEGTVSENKDLQYYDEEIKSIAKTLQH